MALPEINISNINGVLFDLGGTLIRYINDPSQDVFEKFNEKLLSNDPKITFYDFSMIIDRYWVDMPREFYSSAENLDITEFNREFLLKLGFSYDTSLNQAGFFSDIIFELELEGTILIKGALQLLQHLKIINQKIGIITNASHSEVRIRQLLRKVEIENYFDTVVVSSEVGIRKPNAAIFQKALDNLNLEPAEVIFIGDNEEHDTQGAINVGMQAITVGKEITLFSILEIFK